MNLQEEIFRIKKIMVISEEDEANDLPEKPDSHLFNDRWLSQLETDGEYVTLYHFGPSNLEYLDPLKFGENSYTSSEQWWGKKRIFFYTNLNQKERIVSGTLYEVDVKLSDLYPFNADPLNLYDIAAKKYGSDNVHIRCRSFICQVCLKKWDTKE